MTKLVRPNPSVEVRCRVALRQLGEMFPDAVIDANRAHPKDAYLKNVAPNVVRLSLGRLLVTLKARLAELLGCSVSDLRLDHDPALENREKRFNRAGVHVDYVPPANDKDFLRYRPHATTFAGSHDVKTRIRGDHGQLSDNSLAKKERKRRRKLDPSRRVKKIQQRKNPWPKGRKLRSRRKS